jgi:DNA-binding MarR family transcriptional regulator
MAVVHQLRAVSVALNLAAAEFAEANGLHVTDLRALIELLDAERDGVVATPGWLGERLRLGSASATALVDRLERLGHVRRTRDDADRRRVLLAVTPTAKALGWAFFGPLMRRVIDATAGLDEAQLATLRDFLTAVTAAVATERSAAADHPSRP